MLPDRILRCDTLGDSYTNQGRITETQALNKPFFDTLGYVPPAPPQTPAMGGTGSAGPSASSGSNNEPGYLPDYQGDRYTNQGRIAETQALNKPFFDNLGYVPPAPPQTPAMGGARF
ncbi:unnamed protein product [Cylicostephanus goldi]|uniref:Uncharacterized protein n=1 Tax=Cylicostephanus goldi TaxID=71465 RepID=A0A3P6TR73_CYLGO|nr:unnamed protein product [Cylicostephanus goldi]